jgi:hypothetical protein
MITNLQEYADSRDALLERIVTALTADDRVTAAWLSGSFGRGEADAWADFDLEIAIRDEHVISFLADRPALYASVGTPALVQDEIPGQPGVDERFHLVNYEGAIEVDWSFIPLSEARKPLTCRVLFEKQPVPIVDQAPLTEAERRAQVRTWAKFFWSMAPIAVKFAGRGDTRRAIAQTTLLSRALICLWRLLEQPDGPSPWQPETNRPLEDDLDRRLPKPGPVLTPRSVLALTRLLCQQAETLQESLVAFGAYVDQRIIADTERLAAIAAAEIARGRFPAQRYR